MAAPGRRTSHAIEPAEVRSPLEGEREAHAEPPDDHLGDVREHDDGEREREERDARLDGRVVQYLLQVERQQEELWRMQRRTGHRCVRSRERRDPEDPQRQERRGRTRLDDEEEFDERDRGRDQADCRPGVQPSVVARVSP